MPLLKDNITDDVVVVAVAMTTPYDDANMEEMSSY